MTKADTPIDSYPWRDRYFARRVPWNWHSSDRIDVLDDHDGVLRTLDFWQTLVFFHADANRTVARLIDWFPSQYRDPAAVPPDFDKAILGALKELVEDLNLVELWDRSEDLPYLFDLPRKEQDEEEAQRSRLEQGSTL